MAYTSVGLGLEVRQVGGGTLIRWRGGASRRARDSLLMVVVGAVLCALPFVVSGLFGAPHGSSGLLLALWVGAVSLGFLGLFGGVALILIGGWRLVLGGGGALRFVKYDDGGVFIDGARLDWPAVSGLHLLEGGVAVTEAPATRPDRPVHDLYAGRTPIAEGLTWAQGQEVLRLLELERTRALGGGGAKLPDEGGVSGLDTVSLTTGLDAVELTWKGRSALRLVLALAIAALGWPVFRFGMSSDVLLGVPALALAGLLVVGAAVFAVGALRSTKHRVKISGAGVRFDETTTDWSEVGEVQVADEAQPESIARAEGLLGRVENAVLRVASQPHLRRTWQVVSVGVSEVRPLARNLSRDEARRIVQAIEQFRPKEIGERDREAEAAIFGMRGVEKEGVG